MIDITVPADVWVEWKEDEKVERYRDLCRVFGRLWKVLILCGAIVVGALGTVPKRLPSYLALLDKNLSLEVLQKSAILGTARILRRTVSLVCSGFETKLASDRKPAFGSATGSL